VRHVRTGSIKLMRYSVFLCVAVSHELSLRHSQLARMRNVARGPINFMWYSVLQYVAVPHELSLSHIRQIRVRSPNRFLYPLPRTFLQINLFGGNHIHGLKRRPDNKFGRVKRGEINKICLSSEIVTVSDLKSMHLLCDNLIHGLEHRPDNIFGSEKRGKCQ